MRPLFICIFLFIFNGKAFSQEEPYYELPKNRGSNLEIKGLPNLNVFDIKYYINLSGGINGLKSKIINNSEEIVSQRKDFGTYWEVNIGQNRNDNFFYEVGFTQFSTTLLTEFQSINGNPYPITFSNGGKINYVPFRVKKRILVIDKIARNSFFNVGAGVGYYFYDNDTREKTATAQLISYRPRQNINITSIDYEYRYNKKPINLELLTELRGKPTEKLELCIYFKTIVNFNNTLENHYQLKYSNGNTASVIHKTGNLNFFFGIQVQLNSPTYHKYLPNN